MIPVYAGSNPASSVSNGSLYPAEQRKITPSVYVGSNPHRWILQDNALHTFLLSFIVAVYALGHTLPLVVASKPQWQFSVSLCSVEVGISTVVTQKSDER